MIPKSLHFVWIGSTPPWWAQNNMRMFQELNPDFAFRLHGEEVLLEAFRYAYSRIDGPHLLARRSDLLRLSALLRYGGGWYFDCDFLPICPLSELYKDYNYFPKDAFVTHCDYFHGRPWMANGILGMTSTSPFFALIVAEVVRRGDCEKVLKWDTFGPGLITPLVENYPDQVDVGALDGFYRLTNRNRSMAVYKRIAQAGYTREAMVAALGEPLPYMMHQSMQDQLEL